MDDERVRELVRQLDEAVPREGEVEVDSDYQGGTLVQANRLGYLRLGIELLRAANAPTRDDDLLDQVDVDLGYLTGLDQHCYSFQRREGLARRTSGGEPATVAAAAAGGLTAVLVVVFVLASLVVGAITILGWLARTFL